MNQPPTTGPTPPPDGGGSPTSRSKGGCLGFLIALGSFFYLGVVVLALWVLLWWADVWWPATIVLFAPRCLLALPLLLLLPAALFYRRRSLILALLAAAVLLVPVTGFCIPWGRLFPSSPAGVPFTVLTCNMHYRKGNVPSLKELLAATGPDIVALQEWPGAKMSEFLPGTGWHVNDEHHKLFLASRHPILKATPLGFNAEGPEGSVMRYDLDTPAGVVHLFSLHFASPRAGISEAIREEGTGSPVRANMALRWQQSENVADAASQVRGPRLIVGDFNTPPESGIFRYVWNDWTDSFGAAGWGWGYTFFGGKTMVRIDHILTDRRWYCTSCRVGPNVGSPHHPVIAELICTAK